MKTKADLQFDRNHAVATAEDIQAAADKANRLPTPDETTKMKTLLADADSIDAQIATLDAHDELRDRISNKRKAYNEPGTLRVPVAVISNGDVPSDVRVIPTHLRVGTLKAFTPARFGDSAEKANLAAYKSAMYIAAGLYGDRKADNWLRNNVGPDWRNAHSEGVNSEGGYLVPQEMSQAIIDLREANGVFRQNVRVRPMASDTMTIPRKASRFSATWTPEATALTQSSTAFDQVRLTVSKLGGYALISSELAEDAVVSIVDELTKDMGIALAESEDKAGFTGDGSATYGGIRGLTDLFTAGSLAGAVDAVSGHDLFSEVDVDDVLSVIGKLPDYARPNAKIFCSRMCASIVFGSLKASAGGNSITTLGGSVYGDFLGIPIVISQWLPSTTSTINNTAMFFYGDLQMSSSLGERRGVQVKRSDEIKFLEDQIALKITERVDIVHHDVGDGTTAGPMVALIGNT